MSGTFLKGVFYGKHVCLLIMALCFSLLTFSQEEVTITGTVTDSLNKVPLPGVSVLVRGSAR